MRTMVSQTGIRSGRTSESATNSTLQLGVDTDRFLCYSKIIIKKQEGQNVRINRARGNHFHNNQVFSGHHVVRDQGRCGADRLVFPIRGFAVDLWGFDSFTY